MDLIYALAGTGQASSYNSETFCDTIPNEVMNIVHMIYLAIQILTPLLLVIFGAIDMIRALTQQKDDEIKKAQAGLIKKVIVAIIVFLILTIAQWVVGLASKATNGSDASANGWGCACKLLKGQNGSCN
jgi:hypothetical protein